LNVQGFSGRYDRYDRFSGRYDRLGLRRLEKTA
jgi:hypothetical protein